VFVWRSQGNRGSVISPVFSISHVRTGAFDGETAKNCAEHGKIHSGPESASAGKALDLDSEADMCEKLHEDAQCLHAVLLGRLNQE